MAEMTREDVYDVIDGERQYQIEAAQSAERPDMIPALSVGETIVAMEYALEEARRTWYSGNGKHPEAMNYIRKITALGVQAGENFGMPRREGY